MAEKILITRLVGLGDVASILIPAVRMVRSTNPKALIDVLTYQAGVELMSLCQDINYVLSVTAEQWPQDLPAATESFFDIAQVIATQGYDRVICLDTWFMPCFLARVLKDVDIRVEGNYIDMPVAAFFQKLHKGQLAGEYFQHTNYMASSYPRMKDWQKPWWTKPHGYAHYPEFYLKHCCELDGVVEISLSVEPDLGFKQSTQGKKIIAVSFRGSAAYKNYPQAEALVKQLENKGYYVWSQFDGSQPMQTTLSRLAVTDLLITVATSTQWLARLVDCPSLMLPGAMHPATLGAEITVDQTVDCQYCCQQYCPSGRNYACTNVPVEEVLGKVQQYFS